MSSEEIPPIVHALSGAVASIFSNSFVYPLDLITTRIQTQEKNKKKSRRASGTLLTHDKNYDGLAHALFTIYEEEGAASLWQGVWADNASTMASTFCYHFAYNALRDRRFEAAARKNGGRKPRVLGMVEELSIGAGAGIISRFATSPMSNVVTRSQTQGGSIKDIIKAIYKEKGVTGFWSGMKASIILAANPSISYYLFELQKALLIPKSRRSNPKGLEIFLMSATGKAIATLLLYPIILVKAKTQALRAKSSIWNIIKTILEKDGLGGLYEGAVPQVLKGFLSQGILMLLKDRIASLIIAGYLAINRKSHKIADSGYYFSDTPKTDVNGLIAATQDKVEAAVDQAVSTVKETANDFREASHLDQVYDKVAELAQSARESTNVDGAIDRVKDLAQNAKDQSVLAVEKARDLASAAVEKSDVVGKLSSGVESVQEVFKQSTSSDAGKKVVPDAPEWTGQARPQGVEKINGAEWQGQVKKS